MKTRKLVFTAISAAISFASYAQKGEPVILIVAGEPVTKSDFLYVYNKNNSNGAAIDKKSPVDYMELYINFKLKVKEAVDAGMDTAKAFKQEFSGYQKQLAQPYLTDKAVTENLIKEAYERMKTDVRASHILIKISAEALPKDTLAAWNKINEIRKRALKGEDFGKLAKDLSEDPSAKDNSGDLGYFTSMRMIYPFENGAYNTPVGEISQPVRTKFGYHIIKVVDKRASQGEVKVAHIMIKALKDSGRQATDAAEAKANEIYSKLQAGGDFTELCKQFSDDKSNSKKGGELNWFGSGQMVPEFETTAFALKNKDDYSKPVKTDYGWHIIKLLDKKGLPEFKELEGELKQKISKDSRSQMSRTAVINKIKAEYKFKEKKKVLAAFYAVVDTNIFNGKWTADKAKGLEKELFNLGGVKFTQKGFADYLASHQAKRPKTEIQTYVDNMYKQFVEEELIKYEESKLASKYTDYRMLLNEYRDGILLFNHMEQKVWKKAQIDTVGLQKYYETSKDKFQWEERLDAKLFICKNDSVATATRKMIDAGKTSDEILADMNKTSKLNLKVEAGKYIKDENDYLDEVKWTNNTIQTVKKDGQTIIVIVNDVLAPGPKTLKEAKGLVTTAYQDYLEKEWIKELRGKYKVEVNKEVLATIPTP